jgi:hypothetical protein
VNLLNLYLSYVIRVIRERDKDDVGGHISCMRDERNVYKIFV